MREWPRLRDVALLERARTEVYWSSVVRFRDAAAADDMLGAAAHARAAEALVPILRDV